MLSLKIVSIVASPAKIDTFRPKQLGSFACVRVVTGQTLSAGCRRMHMSRFEAKVSGLVTTETKSRTRFL